MHAGWAAGGSLPREQIKHSMHSTGAMLAEVGVNGPAGLVAIGGEGTARSPCRSRLPGRIVRP